jgi:replicative DNA helicase
VTKEGTKKKETVIFDVENEQIILSQMIKNVAIRKRCCRELNENLFIGKRHKIIFRVLSEMVSRGLDYNHDTFKILSNEEDFGGFKYLNDLEEVFADNQNIDFHIQRLKLDSKKINLKKDKVKQLNDALEDPSIDANKLFNIVDGIQKELKDVFITSNISKGKELKKEYFKVLAERQEESRFVGIGFSIDDDLTEGFARKKVSVIAARPSMGKSTFAANICDNLRKFKVPTLVLPLEMGKESFIDLVVSKRTKIPLNDIIKNTKDLTRDQKILIQKEVTELLDDEYLHFIDDTSIKLNDLRTILNNSNYAVCIIDLFEKISDISFEPKILSNQLKQIQSIAKESNTHICLLAQIRRFDPKSKEKRPTLEMLKNSGSYEEVADLILLLHREFYYKPELGQDVLEVIIAKQRLGVRNKSYFYEFYPNIATISKELTDYVPLGDVF